MNPKEIVTETRTRVENITMEFLSELLPLATTEEKLQIREVLKHHDPDTEARHRLIGATLDRIIFRITQERVLAEMRGEE